MVILGYSLRRVRTPRGVAKSETTYTLSSLTPCSFRILRATLVVAPVSVEGRGRDSDGWLSLSNH